MKGRARGATGAGVVPAVAVLALVPNPAAGQAGGSALFPTERYFDIAVAAPREPRFSGSLVSTDLMERAPTPGMAPEPAGAERETQIAVALGGTLRLWRPAAWTGGGAILGIQAGVFGRFRTDTTNQLVATDWLVGVPVEARKGRLSGRVRFLHWSAHLGDEFIEETGSERNDFTFEALDVVAAWDTGPFRVYGGGARVLRSQLADADDAPPGFSDESTLQLGTDGRWYPWHGGTVGLRVGLDLQWSDRSDWRGQIAGMAALEARGGGRALRLGLSWFDGPSSLGQFFLDHESLWGLEVRVDL